jgi:hypothetical protein
MSTRLIVETEGKGRSFSALVLARVYAPCAWEAGLRERDRHRPAMMLLAAMPEEAGALTANLREGRKMRLHGDGLSSRDGEKCEILRSERFTITPQRTDEGTLLLVRHPGLFTYSPGMVAEDVRFVCLPPVARLRQEAARFDGAAMRRHLKRCGFAPWDEEEERRRTYGQSKSKARLVHGLDDPLFPTFAALLVAGVAQRVGFPILDEPLFWAQFAAALLADGLAHRAPERCYDPEIRPYAEVGVADCGFYPGAAVAATQKQIGELLARETSSFLRR